MPWRPEFGPNSPFSGEERTTCDDVVAALHRSERPEAAAVLETIAAHFQRLEAFGELLSQFPSPLMRHRLGSREQSLESLAEGLCQSTPANFEFRAPTRAIVGRALDMAELNFYRLLGYACDEVLVGEEGTRLRTATTRQLREVIYTKLVEEVLGDVVSDDSVLRTTRFRAVYGLAQIWERRLTYRTREFFPLLEASWEARNRVSVVGGTLLGTQEMFSLFREGCAPEFVEYFVRPEPTDDEVAAFREFLFGASAEELESLAQRMDRERRASLPLGNGCGRSLSLSGADAGTSLYEFFRVRFLKATARRLAGLPGPKRTAEGYVMIDFLARSADADLMPR
ncbi:MAG: hypothetical protein JW751_24930 [Polyangiaceae bacterium]|nr:hypothetical protein [Polyangiaceae bacterium]